MAWTGNDMGLPRRDIARMMNFSAGQKKRRAALIGLASAVVATIASASPAHASDYRVEKSVKFSVNALNDVNPCQGWAWIGQTWNGSIESSTSVTCPGGTSNWNMTAKATVSGSALGSPMYAQHASTCALSNGYCISSVSTGGANGKTYCNNAYGTDNRVINREGFTNVCIKT